MNALVPFDYAALAADDLATVRDAETAINARLRRTFDEATAIGRELARVKGVLGHGRFEAWVEQSFDFAITSARNFMRLAAAPLEPATVAGLPLGILYQVASPDLSQDHRAEVLALRDDGQRPDEGEVRSRLAYVRRTLKESKRQAELDARLTSRQRSSRKSAAKRREREAVDWRARLAEDNRLREIATVKLLGMLRESFTPDDLNEVKQCLRIVHAYEIIDRLGG